MIKIRWHITRPSRGMGGEILMPSWQGRNICANLLSVCRQVGAHLGANQFPVEDGLQWDSNPRTSTLAC